MLATLLAPLGSKPQLVTLALDLLLSLAEPVDRVVAVHTTLHRPSTASSLARLQDEFSRSYPSLSLRPICLCGEEGLPLDDVDCQEGVREAFRLLYGEIKAAKQAGRRVHLSIAGGRKTLAVYGMAAAQLLFDEGDRVWHLLSTPALIERQSLHAAPGEVHLLRVPVLRWSQIDPVLTDLALSDDPFEAVRLQEQLRQADRLRLPRSFERAVLTGAERRAVALAVREGLTDAQIAERLCRSPKTVGHQLSAAYAKARDHFGLDRVDRRILTRLLLPYYQGDGQK